MERDFEEARSQVVFWGEPFSESRIQNPESRIQKSEFRIKYPYL